MKPTDEQAEIRDAAATLRKGDNLLAIARAGSGKTSTLKLIAEVRRDRGIYLTFNKSIAVEAGRKLQHTKCRSRTMHQIAFGAMCNVGLDKPTQVNARSIVESGTLGDFHFPKIKGWAEFRLAAAVSRTMENFAASDEGDFLLHHAEAALMESMGDPEFIAAEDKSQYVRDAIDKLAQPISEAANTHWKSCMDDYEFSHDMYLKMLDLDDGLRRDAFARYRYVMVDEAQDLNPVQRSILMKTGLPLVAVGDPYQQIYSWRGAENALDQIPGKTLYLTKSFRFGENIAAIARTILNEIPDSEGQDKRLEGVGPGSAEGGPKGAILCRTNIGMLDEAIAYVNKGFRVHVDNIKGLLDDAESAQALKDGRLDDIKSADLKQFASWEELEITAEEGGDPGMSKLVNLVNKNMIPDIKKLSQRQVDFDHAQLAVFTGHRSKGLEFPAVQLGEDWMDIDAMKARYKGAKAKSEKHVTLARESFNTLYVATTRAMLRCSGFMRILRPDEVANPNRAMTQEEAAREARSRAAYEPG